MTETSIYGIFTDSIVGDVEFEVVMEVEVKCWCKSHGARLTNQNEGNVLWVIVFQGDHLSYKKKKNLRLFFALDSKLNELTNKEIIFTFIKFVKLEWTQILKHWRVIHDFQWFLMFEDFCMFSLNLFKTRCFPRTRIFPVAKSFRVVSRLENSQ